MSKTRPIKNPQDEPMPNLRCEEEIYLRPVGFSSKFFDDGIELPVYFYPDQGLRPVGWLLHDTFGPPVYSDRDSLSLDPMTLGPLPANPLSLGPGGEGLHLDPGPNESICYVPMPMDKWPQWDPLWD